MQLTPDDRRPACLTEIRKALIALPGTDQVRLGVIEDWKNGPHQLTYRQTERTFNLVADAPGKEHAAGPPPRNPARVRDDPLGARIPPPSNDASTGYAHRDAAAWAIPLRQAGAQLIQDLHPADRGPRGTHHGAIIANGNLYCPQTPTPLLQLGPLARDATSDEITAHDTRAGELARHKLGRISADDADGYHRIMCPAAMVKIRCP